MIPRIYVPCDSGTIALGADKVARAIEAEVADFLDKHADLKTGDGHQRVVRHGQTRNATLRQNGEGAAPPGIASLS